MERRKINVFIASPGDLKDERQEFRKTMQLLNVGFGDGASVEFVPLGWENTLASTGPRVQSVINTDIDRCDIFILAMYRRWGQGAPDAEPYTSYTEEEFHRALERWKTSGTPEIFVFFKRVDAESEADPGPELRKVMEFRKHLEETRQVLYRYFDSPESLMEEIDKHLRAYVKCELPRADELREAVVLPMAALNEIEKAKKIAKEKEIEAEKARDAEKQANLKLEIRDLQLAEDAATLAKEGKVEFARQKFAKLAVESVNLQVLYFAYEFFYRTGDLDTAIMVIEKWLDLSGRDCETGATAAAYSNLGDLYRTRSEHQLAIDLYLKSLAIYEAIDRKEGISVLFGKLGILNQALGELQQAEDFYMKSLSMHEALGDKVGMADQFGNLGTLYQTRGEHKRAIKMYLKSLSINEALDRKEGMANIYNNLGVLHQTHNEFDQAEEMHLASLSIYEKLDHKEGMASNYCNLGLLFKNIGELDLAKKMYLKSLAKYEDLGRKEGMANNYCNLGILHLMNGEFELAEKMYLKSLAIDEAIGRKEGMASDFGNLGYLYQIRGDYIQAEKMYLKSLELHELLGRKEGMAKDYGNLENLYRTHCEFQRAEEMRQKLLEILNQLS